MKTYKELINQGYVLCTVTAIKDIGNELILSLNGAGFEVSYKKDYFCYVQTLGSKLIKKIPVTNLSSHVSLIVNDQSWIQIYHQFFPENYGHQEVSKYKRKCFKANEFDKYLNENVVSDFNKFEKLYHFSTTSKRQVILKNGLAPSTHSGSVIKYENRLHLFAGLNHLYQIKDLVGTYDELDLWEIDTTKLNLSLQIDNNAEIENCFYTKCMISPNHIKIKATFSL